MLDKIKSFCNFENLPLIGLFLASSFMLPLIGLSAGPVNYIILVASLSLFTVLSVRRFYKTKADEQNGVHIFFKLALLFLLVALLSSLLNPGFLYSFFAYWGASDSLLYIALLVFTGLIISKHRESGFFDFLALMVQLTFVFNALYLIAQIFLQLPLFASLNGTLFESNMELSVFVSIAFIMSILKNNKNAFERILTLLVLPLSVIFMIFINLYIIWVFTLFAALLVLFFRIPKRSFKKDWKSLLLGFVTLLSLFFLLFGASVQKSLFKYTNILFIDRTPSMVASLDILNNSQKSVKNKLLGTGPASFAQDWYTYKSDPRLNITVGWDNTYPYAYNSILHYLISFGWLGAIFWILLLFSILAYLFKFLWAAPYKRKAKGELIYSYILLLTVALTFLFYTPGYIILAVFFLLLANFVVLLRKNSLFKENKKSEISNKFVIVKRVICRSAVLSTAFSGLLLSASFIFLVALTIAVIFVVDAKKIDNIYKLAKLETYVMPYNSTPYINLAKANKDLLAKELNSTRGKDKQISINAKIFADRIISAYRSAILVNPRDFRLHLALARAYGIKYSLIRDENIYQKALQSIAKAEKLAPLHPDVTYTLASLSALKNDLKTYKNALLSTLAIQPNYDRAYDDLFTLAIASKDVNSALQVARASVQNEPNSPAAWGRLAIALYSAGKYADAALASTKSINMSNGVINLNVLYIHAFALSKIGRKEQAVKEVEKILKISQNKQLLLLLKKLQSEDKNEANPKEPQKKLEKEGVKDEETNKDN